MIVNIFLFASDLNTFFSAATSTPFLLQLLELRRKMQATCSEYRLPGLFVMLFVLLILKKEND